MDLGELTNAAFGGIAVFGALLAAVAIAAWRRTPTVRMALVALAFLLFAAQGVVVGVGLFTSGLSLSDLLALSAGFEAALLAVMFAATLLR